MKSFPGTPVPTIRQAVILAGGRGGRLGALTNTTPKPLLRVGGRPFVAWLVRELCRFGVEEVLLLTGYLGDVVEAALPEIRAGLPRAVALRCLREPAPAGTGGAVRHAAAELDARFLLLNGDSWLDFNLARLLADAAHGPATELGRMVLRPEADTGRFGVVECDGGRVTAFRDRPETPQAGLINAGIYLFSRAVLDEIPPAASLERDLLPRLAARGALHSTIAEGYFIDIGVPEDLARARAEMPARFDPRERIKGCSTQRIMQP
jgi:D-glycero-D-manno-heptose 1,7-bisphosphate phosphatase